MYSSLLNIFYYDNYNVIGGMIDGIANVAIFILSGVAKSPLRKYTYV